MKIALGLVALFLLSGCSSKCDDGCLVVDGEKIPFFDAETLVSNCNHFINSSSSRLAVGLSYEEISERTNNDPNTPLMSTYMSYISISESPLVFNRNEENSHLKHNQIVQACVQLRRDFNSDRYWVN
ncbi:hypothetical protein [Acinetobacter schindleri]|uniref:hypothetical protein n=1 Tax=Acinetobacter schindleri TaxID=108981 RepID=UPI001613AB6F|nr:hypothetical protein [Acinetobacter schindleri]MBB4836617.1 hypothetical protein [Acinetobacter schindleri]WBX36799.1 hypothetical protein MYA84_08640 [Acinetobacter schindleri]